ncbi:MAG: IS66 family transposase, partial [Planctomycetes bacterium]|nr:IS66 family transposase [Planctomycetota bacterium]MBM4068279.1 IS66 family transposase [Planctomycetota bacterium]MBM4068572.1 IS66 family transposase [Planctomycetota bacterium]MBM4068614.1 IS66 family transposase [Planctomycetota bacterium]MBM4069889.1 IS66 family transposase [Planctomycetota bacterium]
MDAPPTVSAEVLASLPPEVLALIKWQAEQIRVLTARVAELEAKLGKNPSNSSKPPSTTHPHYKKPAAKPKSG